MLTDLLGSTGRRGVPGRNFGRKNADNKQTAFAIPQKEPLSNIAAFKQQIFLHSVSVRLMINVAFSLSVFLNNLASGVANALAPFFAVVALD